MSEEDIRQALEVERLFGTELMLGNAGKARERKLTLEDVREWIGDCRRCDLSEQRNMIVFGEGDPKARLFFIGEGPGADEDKQGRPFVGRAGQMLTKIIENVLLLKREDVYIANVVKCRPPGNRNPQPDEAATCMPYLMKQIEVVEPEIIVLLGGVATKYILEDAAPIGKLRGRFHTWKGAKLMPTYHPAYLLRNPGEKRKVFEDMVKVRDELGIVAPE